MRLGEQRETADAAGMIELMPSDFAEYVEIEIAYDALENCTHAIEICKRCRVAPACIDEPFGSEGHFSPQINTDYSPASEACGRIEGGIGSRKRESVGVPSVSGPR